VLDRADLRTYMVEMRDGVRLATDVYLPKVAIHGSRLRVPVLFSRLPYGRAEQVACLPAIATELGAHGYALVAQDIRGRYGSGGDALPFGTHELRDAYDTLDWIRAQPWARDGVVMVGDSYCGWLQWAAMASGHSSLRAIVPGMTTTGIGDVWMHNSNSFCLRPMIEWAIMAWRTRENSFGDLDWSTRPLSALVTSALGESPAGTAFARWTQSAPGSRYWREGVFGAVRARHINVPALHVGGWWDIFRKGQVRDWQTARKQRADQYMVMSASDHHHVPLLTDPWLGRPDQDDSQLARRYAKIILPFLDQSFSGSQHGAIAPVRYEIAHDGWHETSAWPPKELRRHTLSLVDSSRATLDYHGGGLSRLRSRTSGKLNWAYDPADLVPATESDPFALLVGPADQRIIEGRCDVPTFSSVPLEAPMDLVGESHLVLSGASVRPGRQFVARLCDVFPDGRSFTITEGVVKLPPHAAAGAATLEFQPCAYRLQKQHSLRLEICASSFPRYLPGSTGDPWCDLGDSIEYELDVGGPSGSRLEVSVLES